MQTKLIIETYKPSDLDETIALWEICGLIVPPNDPVRDIELKMSFQPELFFIGKNEGRVAASLMAGYEGHRGWFNYLGVHPDYRKSGAGRAMIDHGVAKLKELGCPKINLQVRKNNSSVISFYEKNGFSENEVISLHMRL